MYFVFYSCIKINRKVDVAPGSMTIAPIKVIQFSSIGGSNIPFLLLLDL